MAEQITFGDVEAGLVTYLGALVGVPVVTNIPNPRPASFVRVLRTGGVRTALTVEAPTVAVESWAANEVAAATLAQLCRALIHAADTLGGCEVLLTEEASGPANLPDPTSSQARYTATYQITLGL